MLPVSQDWYRKLLIAALFLGAGGGVAAVVYSAVTGAGIGLFFGDPRSDPWSGEWWWIPLISLGAILVVALRGWWHVPEKVTGAVGLARQGWVDPSSAFRLFAVSAVSLFVGASLGPSFGIVVSGGGLGAWLVSRSSTDETEANQEYALTGMAGGLGAVFSAPLFAAVMGSELSPTRKTNYVAAFIPQLLAATIGYVIFFGVTGKVMLDAFGISGYEYENVHLLYGALLGLFSVIVLVVQELIGKALRRIVPLMTNPVLRAGLAGAMIGLIAFALPLTATGGGSQLAYETANLATLGAGLLLVVLIGKMIAFTLSTEAGFIGGPVFPILFIGGTAGILVHTLLPGIPAPLAVAAMIAAVPGGTIGAPVGFILLGAGVVGVGISGIAPVGIAVVTAHLAVWGVTLFEETREDL